MKKSRRWICVVCFGGVICFVAYMVFQRRTALEESSFSFEKILDGNANQVAGYISDEELSLLKSDRKAVAGILDQLVTPIYQGCTVTRKIHEYSSSDESSAVAVFEIQCKGEKALSGIQVFTDGKRYVTSLEAIFRGKWSDQASITGTADGRSQGQIWLEGLRRDRKALETAGFQGFAYMDDPTKYRSFNELEELYASIQ